LTRAGNIDQVGIDYYEASTRDCSVKKVEMRFAQMKRILRLDRLRLRGLSGAMDEVLLTATAQNLRRFAKRLCWAVRITAPAWRWPVQISGRL